MMTADLIARLEAASAGSEVLDTAIKKVVGRNDPAACWEAKPYTTSLDAAVALVPDELGWMIRRLPSGACMAVVEMCRPAHAATVPLAVCIAALKARAAK